jgi:hypothetical protein
VRLSFIFKFDLLRTRAQEFPQKIAVMEIIFPA